LIKVIQTRQMRSNILNTSLCQVTGVLVDLQTKALAKGDFHLVTFIQEKFLRNQVGKMSGYEKEYEPSI
jgi:hypothetical protein